jgi:hypothetical protein
MWLFILDKRLHKLFQQYIQIRHFHKSLNANITVGVLPYAFQAITSQITHVNTQVLNAVYFILPYTPALFPSFLCGTLSSLSARLMRRVYQTIYAPFYSTELVRNFHSENV